MTITKACSSCSANVSHSITTNDKLHHLIWAIEDKGDDRNVVHSDNSSEKDKTYTECQCLACDTCKHTLSCALNDASSSNINY